MAKKYFQKLPEGEIKDISKFTPSQIVPKVRIKNKKTDQAHFMLGFLGEGRNYENRYPQSVLSLVLGGGGSSRLWTEVREKRGLAYAVQGSMDRYSDVGYFGVYVGCDIAKTEEATKVILDQCYGLSEKRYKITPKELEKVKGFIKGHLALSLEDSEHVNDFFSEQVLFDKKVLSPEEIFKKVDAVTIDEVYEEAEKLFKSEGLNLAIIGPYENDEKFVKIIK